MTTRQDYLDWARSEPLSDMCVDAENVYVSPDSPEYWALMLRAGQWAVEMRKQEAMK